MKTFVYSLFSLSLMLFMASCGSVSEITPTANYTSQQFSKVVVKDFAYTGDPEETPAQSSKLELPDRIVKNIRSEGGFSSVSRNGSIDSDTLVIDGTITELVEGSGSLRFWFGLFGAGKAHLGANVHYRNGANNAQIGNIRADKNSFLGGVVGGSQDHNYLMDVIAQKVAESAKVYAR